RRARPLASAVCNSPMRISAPCSGIRSARRSARPSTPTRWFAATIATRRFACSAGSSRQPRRVFTRPRPIPRPAFPTKEQVMDWLPRTVACCMLLPLMAPLAQAEDWQLVKDEDGIKVYLAPVAGSKYKAYRGVATMRADVATVAALQEDVPGSCAWIHECREQKLLKTEGALSWTYTRFNTPWPVAPRDSVIRVTSSIGADGSVTRVLEGVPDYLPAEKGFVRVSKVE